MFVYRKAHRAIAAVMAAALGGCGAYHDGGVVRSATLNQQIPVTEAFITPPPGGPAVIAVLENRYSNGLAQDIILDNSSSVGGQNVILVRAYGPMGYEAGRAALETDVPGIAVIRREMAERFPGVHMEVSGLYAQNRYGGFSYATGRSRGGATCVYAWQRIAAEARVFSAQRGAITWRMRVCDDNTDARSLLLLAYGLTINGYFLSKSWNPYGDAPEPDPRIGAPGEAILPEQVVDPTVIAPTSYGEAQRLTVAAPSRGVSRTRRRTASVRQSSRPVYQAPRQAVPTVLNEPVEGAAIVPRPEGTDLSEPIVEDSNLPQTGSQAIRPRTTVPTPPAAQGLRTPTGVRQIPSAPAAPRVTTPQRGADARGPSVRVVDLPR